MSDKQTTKPSKKQPQRIIATKLTPIAFKKFHLLANLFHLSAYEFLQLTIDTYLKFYDQDTSITPQMENLLLSFQDFRQGEKPFYISKNEGTKQPRQINNIIAFVEEKGKEQQQPIFIKQDKDGATETYNINTLLTQVLKTTCPRLYNDIIKVQNDLQASTIIETIHYCIKRQLPTYNISDDINELFADNGRIDFLQKAKYGAESELTKYIRHNIKDIELIGDNNKITLKSTTTSNHSNKEDISYYDTEYNDEF